MNNSGFDNENEIRINLDGKKLSSLNSNLRKLIMCSFNDYNDLIHCAPKAGRSKSDLIVTIGSENHTYSIKKGTGNSLHQEPIEPFLDFLECNFGITESIKNDMRLFIWGDGTLDGTGNIVNRLSASQFKKKYLNKIKNIQQFFNKIKTPLVQRFLIDGSQSNSSADFIYYGTANHGLCCNSAKALKWVVNNQSNGAISIGRLTFQAWNRNIKGGTKSEKKRGVIQIKWGSIKDDIKLIQK